MGLDERVRRFRSDRTSGAAELAREAAEILRAATEAGYASRRLERLRDRLAGAHPAMGAVWNVVHADDPDRTMRDADRGRRRAIRDARRHLPRGSRVVTLSYSSSVFASLRRRDLRVTVAESRPGDDGRRVVRKRAGAGLQTRLVPDAALAVAAREADCAMIGADAVGPTRIVNKVGSRLLALACRDADIPLYVVSDPSKRVPRAWQPPVYGRDQPFESVPRRLVTRVFDGVE